MANGNGENKIESPLQAEAFYIFANLAEPSINGVLQAMRLRGRRIGHSRLRRWSEEFDWAGRLERRADRIHAIAAAREGEFAETLVQMDLRICENLLRISEALMNGIIAVSEEEDGIRILRLEPKKAIDALINVNSFMRQIRGVVKSPAEDTPAAGGNSILNVLQYLSVKVDPKTGKPLNGSGNSNNRIVESFEIIDSSG